MAVFFEMSFTLSLSLSLSLSLPVTITKQINTQQQYSIPVTINTSNNTKQIRGKCLNRRRGCHIKADEMDDARALVGGGNVKGGMSDEGDYLGPILVTAARQLNR